MEPIIYKPSIYKGAGIYKTGASGGGGGGGGLQPDQIVVSGQVIDTIEINGLIWATQDFKEVLDGIVYAPSDKWYMGAACKIYNGDVATYGPYGQDRGLLYNASSRPIIQNYLDENLPGWRLPTWEDFKSLVNSQGGFNSSTFLKLAAAKNWTNQTGITNESGFSAVPTGRVSSGNFSDVNGAFYLCYKGSQPLYALFLTNSPNNVQQGSMNINYEYCAVRFCKNA